MLWPPLRRQLGNWIAQHQRRRKRLRVPYLSVGNGLYGTVTVGLAGGSSSHISFDVGMLTTKTLWASPSQLSGSGVINHATPGT